MTDIRKAFEARSVPNLNLKRNDDGAYHYGVTRMAYRDFCDGYQAGRADERKAVMEMLGSEEMVEATIMAIRKVDDEEALPTYNGFAKASLSAIRKALGGDDE